ncbi:MAG: hypothetical protein GEU88_15135 [Solirubrobacterales bacterium]|nr:hypothetical protein [Solirubrobacterales bacterium]
MTHGTVAPSKDRSAIDPGVSGALERVLDRLAVENLRIPERLLVWLVGGLAGTALAVLPLLALVR